MLSSCHSHRDVPSLSTRAVISRVEELVCAWTGRSAMLGVTETPLSRFATAGAHQTRVSAMRLFLPRAERRLRGESPAWHRRVSPESARERD